MHKLTTTPFSWEKPTLARTMSHLWFFSVCPMINLTPSLTRLLFFILRDPNCYALRRHTNLYQISGCVLKFSEYNRLVLRGKNKIHPPPKIWNRIIWLAGIHAFIIHGVTEAGYRVMPVQEKEFMWWYRFEIATSDSWTYSACLSRNRLNEILHVLV